MSERTKKIAQLLLADEAPIKIIQTKKEKKTNLDLAQFLADIKARLKAIKFEAGNTIEHRGLYGREIPEFLKDCFPEITDQNNFLAGLETFGLRRGPFKRFKDFFSDAYVFFDQEKTGFIMVQQSAGIHPVEQSHFCLMYQVEGKNKTPVVNIAGVNKGRILTAEYRFEPKNGQYVRRCLDIGVGQDELPGSIEVNNDYFQLHPWLTATMREKAPLCQNLVRIEGETTAKISPSDSLISRIPARL